MAILDTFSGAYAGYSICRKVRDAYSGSLLRIRRSSDNAEQNIGFDGSGNLDTASIASFCGAGNGFVTTIYDQVGSNNLVQATAGRQPVIYSSGSQVTDGGLPAITFDGTDDYLRVTLGASLAQPFSLFHVRRYNANTGTKVAFGFHVESDGYADINASNLFRTFFGSYLGSFTQNTSRQMWAACINGASSAVGLNDGTLTTGNAGSLSATRFSLGSTANSAGTTVFFPAPINFQEALIYNSNQQSNKSGIFTAVNSYFGLEKSITLTTPKAGGGIVDEQTRGGTQAQNTINLTGTAAGFTGAIEARFNSGSWSTIATITGSGAWSGSLSNVAYGRGSIEVREVADTGNSASVANFGVGYVFIATGDSNAEGSMTNAQTHGLSSNKPFAIRKGQSTFSEFTSLQNHWIKLATQVTTRTSRPVTFVHHGTGSQDLALRGTTAQQSYNSAGSNYAALVALIATSGITSFNACLCSFGPNAAGVTSPVLTADEYVDAIKSFRDALRTSISQPTLPVYLGVFGKSSATTSGNPNVRNGIAKAIRKGILAGGPNLIDQDWSDGVHWKTDAEGALVSGRWDAVLAGNQSPRLKKFTKVSEDTVELTFDREIVDGTYTGACFTFDDGTVNSAFATSTTTIQVEFTAPANPTTVTIFPLETAIGATIPTGEVYTLPVTINGVVSVVLPVDPVQSFVNPQSGSGRIIDPVFTTVFKPVFSKVME